MRIVILFFFFNDTATTEIYTLSLHDALPIYKAGDGSHVSDADTAERRRFLFRQLPREGCAGQGPLHQPLLRGRDRKSTRLNSSHANISYAVFCLKKKNNVLLS